MNYNPSCPGKAVRRTASLPLAYVPGIHVFRLRRKQVVDGRDKPGHDEKRIREIICLPMSDRACPVRQVSKHHSWSKPCRPLSTPRRDRIPRSWLSRILNGLAILFPQFSQILLGLNLGLMMWGGPWLHNRGFRTLNAFSY
jgi:hypothetical protein